MLHSNSHTDYITKVHGNTHIPPKIFTSLHFTSLHFTSLPIFHFPPLLGVLSSRLKSLHFPSLHSTSIHFTLHRCTSRIITFLTLYLKICDMQEKVASVSAGSCFRSLMVLFTKEYFPISLLCSLTLIFRSSSSLLR